MSLAYPAKYTEIEISRLFNNDGDERIFLAEETATTTSTRADFLDLTNIIGTADEITGLARLETNRLAIFTNDQAIIYKVDPDICEL